MGRGIVSGRRWTGWAAMAILLAAAGCSKERGGRTTEGEALAKTEELKKAIATRNAEIEDLQRRISAMNEPRPASAPAGVPAAAKAIIINVLKDGSVQVDGASFTKDELVEFLRGVARKTAGAAAMHLLIRADKGCPYKFAADVVEAAWRAGIDKTRIGFEAVPADAPTSSAP